MIKNLKQLKAEFNNNAAAAPACQDEGDAELADFDHLYGLKFIKANKKFLQHSNSVKENEEFETNKRAE